MPLLIRGPLVPAGETSDALVGNIDLAPTIAELANARPTIDVDGQSALGFARNPLETTDRALLLESLARNRSTPYGYRFQAVRSGHFLYAEYETGDEELYNLVRDPFQLRSVAGEPRVRGQAAGPGAGARRAARLPGRGLRRERQADPARRHRLSRARRGYWAGTWTWLSSHCT